MRGAAGLAAQVARALAHAHEKGVFHRDLSPANILLDASGAPKVIDFGLADVAGMSTLTMRGPVGGTLPYLSPEVLWDKGRPNDTLCDLYALGVVLYELVTLAHPYPHDSPEALLYRVQSSQPLSPRAVNPAVSRDLDSAMMGAIARLPQDRYASMAAFADDLDNFLEGRPVTRRTSTTTRIRWAIRRKGALVSSVACALLFALLLGGGCLLYERHQRNRQRAAQLVRFSAALSSGDLASAETCLAIARGFGPSEDLAAAEQVAAIARGVDQYRALSGAGPLADQFAIRDALLKQLASAQNLEQFWPALEAYASRNNRIKAREPQEKAAGGKD
jgi:hypothetical protein